MKRERERVCVCVCVCVCVLRVCVFVCVCVKKKRILNDSRPIDVIKSTAPVASRKPLFLFPFCGAPRHLHPFSFSFFCFSFFSVFLFPFFLFSFFILFFGGSKLVLPNFILRHTIPLSFTPSSFGFNEEKE